MSIKNTSKTLNKKLQIKRAFKIEIFEPFLKDRIT